MGSKLIFRQLFDKTSHTYTYLLACGHSRSALLIDPVLEQVDRDLQLVEQLDLRLKYVVNTHVHADHVTGSGLIKQRLNPEGPISDHNSNVTQNGRDLSPTRVLSVLSKAAGARADWMLSEEDKIRLGKSVELSVLPTPGHTNGCVSYYEPRHGIVFTGDALLIRGCGRTDFQQGDAGKLYDSVTQRLFTLPNDTLVFPAHDYLGRTMSTIGEEKRFNPRLSQSKEKFLEIMANLKLDYPKMIDLALPLNLVCGIQE